MSLHIAVFAPATRVMSRKLGPTWRSASPCVGQPRGGLRGEHVREHVRQVAEDGHEPVVRVSASTATGRAPRSTTKRCRRS